MKLKRASALLLVVLCTQCGGESTTGSTTPTPAPSPVTPVPPPTVPTQPIPAPPAAPQLFVGAGDIGLCGSPGPAQTARLLDNIGGTVFTLGDNAYLSGTAREFRDCYDPTWGRHKSRTRPVPGNHEYETPGAAPYFDYFGPNAGPPGLGYYSFDIGAWHAIALNSNPPQVPVGINSAQGAWLRADLAANSSRCTLAYWHHPLFTSGPNGNSLEMRGFWRLLYDAGADVILVGHDHLYERFAPQDPDGRFDPQRGIREFVVGTGGAMFYQIVNLQPNSEARVTEVFGVLKLVLESDSYQWEFVTTSGVRDSGTAMCH